MSQKLRIGVIGAGANTRAKHIPGFMALDGVEVTVVCNRSQESGKRVAREFGIRYVGTSWRDIIDSKEIDAICIGTWPNMHAKLVVAALRAGKHVLTEARMARNLAEAEMMLEESRLHPSLVAQIVPAPMSLPFDATIMALLKDGTLGSLREVVINCTNDGYADSLARRSWRQDNAISGKNTLYLGIYYEMVLRWLGQGVSALIADSSVFAKERRDEDGVPWPMTIPESVTVLGRYAPARDSGLSEATRLIAHFSGVERTPPRNEIRLNGSAAGLRLDFATNELWLAKSGQKEQLVEIPPAKRGEWRVEADFVDSIRFRRPVHLTNFETGVQYMQFTDAVWESWNSFGQRVTL